jgi:hypothetical protein
MFNGVGHVHTKVIYLQSLQALQIPFCGFEALKHVRWYRGGYIANSCNTEEERIGLVGHSLVL